jgi:hypothetical protein
MKGAYMMTESLAYDEVRVDIDLPEPLYQRLVSRSQEMGMELPQLVSHILLCNYRGEECEL